jgi:hypothetical protein
MNSPLKVARWRPLVHWLLAFPHFIILYGLNIAQGVVYFISWFAILFTGKMPEGFYNFLAMVHRYQWRVVSYLFWMRESYPPFEFNSVAQDPGDDPAVLSFPPAPAKLSRGLIFVKWLLAIPHFFILTFLGLAAFVVLIIGFFAILITGSWPAGMRNFLVGLERWSARVTMYTYLMTDQYPPFSLT